jgi:hypothetical protein
MTASDKSPTPELLSGNRLPYDARSAIAKLASGQSDAAWSELWDELHHQGDVDTASYAAVPELVALYRTRTVPDWNVYALVGTIELSRARGNNPDVPSWLVSEYRLALATLADLAGQDLRETMDPLVARSALGIIALVKNLRAHAQVLLELDLSEVEEILDGMGGA